MAASNSTPRFGLPDWAASDGVLRTDFNDAFSTVDDLAIIGRTGTASVDAYDASDPEYQKSFYFQTTLELLWWSDGTQWHLISAGNPVNTDLVSDGLLLDSGKLTVRDGDGLGLTGTSGSKSLYVKTGSTLDISSDSVIVKAASLTQTQAASTYRFARTGTPSADVAQGDLTVDSSSNFYVRNASAWVRPTNMPWGLLSFTALPAGSQSSILTETDVSVNSTPLSGSFTAVADRAYRITAVLSNVATTLPTVNKITADLRIKIGSTVYGRGIALCPADGTNTYGTSVRAETVVTGLSAGTKTFKATLQAVGGAVGYLSITQTANDRSFITVEDIGPA